jgi:hypothetical protein
MKGGDPASMDAVPVPDEPLPEEGAEPPDAADTLPVLPGTPLAAAADPDGTLPEPATLPAFCTLPAPPPLCKLPAVAAVAPLPALAPPPRAPGVLELAEHAARATQPESEKAYSGLARVEGTIEYS